MHILVMDNFRHPKRPNRHAPLDGIIKPQKHPTRPSGSISFTSSGQGAPNRNIDDFNRPEGFHAGSRSPVTSPNLTDRPRRPVTSGATPMPAPKQTHKKRSWKRYALRGGLSVLIVIALVSGFLGWKVLRNTTRVFQGSVFGLFDSTKLKGEDKGRVNILLTGTSEDDPGHSGALLTDSIMLISLDTVNHSAFLMSIPRDLWVKYDTNSCVFGNQGKINAVYECGEQIKFKQDGFPNGGLGLMEKVVEEDFGVDINYYVKINYTAFRDAVNAVGGIDYNVQTGDPRGIYDGNIAKVDGGPLKLPSGVQHLNGQTALNLARARCDTVCYGFSKGDFDRSEHQRQMLLALKDKAFTIGVLSNPAKVSSLLDAVGKNVKTDFQTNEIRRLHDLGKQVQNQNIKSIGLADDSVKLVTTGPIGGVSAVRPVAGLFDFTQIQAYLKRLTSNDPVAKEGATVVVLNGSGVSGLAKKKADELAAKGVTVAAVANTTTKTTTRVVALNNQKPTTSTYLGQKFKVTPTNDLAANPEAKNYTADFVIILGSDQQ